MNDYNRTVAYRFKQKLNEIDVSNLQSKLSTVQGISSCNITTESISVEYGTFQLTEEAIKESIKKFGYPIKKEKKKRKGIFRRFIDNLAKRNKKSFGSKKLDC